MRDKISKIVGQYRHSSFDTPEERTEKWNTCTEELTALMCYREARAIIEWIGIDYLMEYEESVVEQLGKTYDSDMVWDAIEQVKNEYHDQER